jgi:DNA-binding CsgD family transcriptional regulator
VKPEHLYCERCAKVVTRVGRRFACDCSHMPSLFNVRDPLPETWRVSVEALTPIHYEVAKLLGQGRTTHEIALLVNRPQPRIKKLLNGARRMLRVRTTYELVARVAQHETQPR